MRVAGADHPGRQAIDTRVKEVEPNVYPFQKVTTHNLLHNGLQFVRENDNMVAVPTHPTADVQQHLVHEGQHRRELVRDRFGGMEVPAIQAQEDIIGNGITQVELVRANDVAFRAEAEEFALDSIQVVARVNLLSKDRIQRVFQEHTRRLAVYRSILQAVRDPNVGHTRRT